MKPKQRKEFHLYASDGSCFHIVPANLEFQTGLCGAKFEAFQVGSKINHLSTHRPAGHLCLRCQGMVYQAEIDLEEMEKEGVFA